MSKKVRFTMEMDEEDHTYFKIAMCQYKMTMKDFTMKAIFDALRKLENEEKKENEKWV